MGRNSKDIDTEIRMALDAKAHEVDVPVDLASRTIELAQKGAKPSLRERLRARLDGLRLRAPVTGYPRWMYAGAAAAMAALLFFVGTFIRNDPVALDQPVAAPSDAEPAIDRDGSGVDLAEGPTVQDEEGTRAKVASGQSAGGTGGSLSGGSTSSQIGPVPPVPPSRPGQFPPKIARTANIEVEVASFDRAWGRATAIAGRHSGYVTSSESGLERGTITMRVPATKLDAAIADLRKLGKVVSMNTTAEDISAQIVDTDARLRTIQAEELQLLEIMKRASGVDQILQVRDRLNSVRQEIESLKGQKELYANQVDFATVNATFYESGADDPDDPGDGILLDAWRTALRAGLTIVAGALVVLGGLIPLAALGLAVWFAVRTIRRRSA